MTGTIDPAAVRTALADRLPAYMVPAAIVVLDGAAVDGQRQTRHPRPAGTRIPDGDHYRAPTDAVEEILAGIYAQVLGLERVGVDDSFFDLGGDSILSMQVVARARAAGLTCRPRDIFVEQTVARLAQVAGVADGIAGPVDEGLGDVVPTPIMRWLHNVDGPSRPVQPDDGGAGAGRSHPGRCGRSCCRPCWIATPCCGCALATATGGWSLQVPEAGFGRRRRLPAIGRRVIRRGAGRGPVAVEPGRRDDAQRAVGDLHRPAGVDRSTTWPSTRCPGGSCWKTSTSPGPNTTTDNPSRCRSTGTSFQRWASATGRTRARPGGGRPGRHLETHRGDPARAAAPRPEIDTYASAGHLSVSLDAETTRLLLGEVPAAFHAGINDILLIAFALACTEFLGTGDTPIGIDVEGHGRDEDLAPDIDLSRTVGWFTTKYPVSLTVGGLRWAQVIAGDAALGAIIKDAKEQLRALPDGLTYGLLRYLNPDVDLAGSDPTIGFNYLGRLGAATAEASDELWRISQDGLSITDAATAVPMPLGHTVELNAGTIDTDTGPHLHATWTWAPSALDHNQISRLSQLWFDALTGICAHVQHGGGGLTPSDITPARLSQQQIDQLQQHHRIADILPLTPLQQGLLFHAGTTQGNHDDLYAMQLDITVTGPLDPHRLRDAVHTVVNRHPNLAARFCQQFDQPVQIIPADPVVPWRYVELDADDATPMSMSRSSACALPNAPRSATSPTRRPSGWR